MLLIFMPGVAWVLALFGHAPMVKTRAEVGDGIEYNAINLSIIAVIILAGVVGAIELIKR